MNLIDLFKKSNILLVPSYQRAYAWEETQLNQFIQDLNEIGKKSYYYGHFILEEREGVYEVIDGQQRLTTFMLFLMVCHARGHKQYLELLDKFQTCDYDQTAFEKIKTEVLSGTFDWKVEKNKEEEPQTSSIRRINFALRYLYKAFDKKEEQTGLSKNKIAEYVDTLLKAYISTHITKDKAVAVQIFELQNSRGIRLDLIEKVKAKLMKAIYISPNSSEASIERVQNAFAEVYHLEELSARNSFRGEMSLDEILLHHLRVIDDGTKLKKSKEVYNSPAWNGPREETILNYIEGKLKEANTIDYACGITEQFLKSVKLFAEDLPMSDKSNPLIGDTLILDRGLTMEFFMVLKASKFEDVLANQAIISAWERLIYFRDFHERLKRLKYKEDFQSLFEKIYQANSVAQILEILKKYNLEGFRNDVLEGKPLPTVVFDYVQSQKECILTMAYRTLQNKMVYLLYKYELSIGANRSNMREVFKKGKSLDHILPQSWRWEWLLKDRNEISKEDHVFNESVMKWIDGVGNLMLIGYAENSSLGNISPTEKRYLCVGGSYSEHEKNKQLWENPANWESITRERGERIYNFLLSYIQEDTQ